MTSCTVYLQMITKGTIVSCDDRCIGTGCTRAQNCKVIAVKWYNHPCMLTHAHANGYHASLANDAACLHAVDGTHILITAIQIYTYTCINN